MLTGLATGESIDNVKSVLVIKKGKKGMYYKSKHTDNCDDPPCLRCLRVSQGQKVSCHVNLCI